MTVWIVSLEWKHPPSEGIGDTGIVGVFMEESAARTCQQETQEEHHDYGDLVYQYSMREGRYHDDGICDRCGADLKDTDSCDNDHDEWDIDVHCTKHDVRKGHT